MADRFTAQKQAYARLIINAGVNLRKGQGVYIQAELGHRDFVRLLTKEAYAAGAKMVMADWRDPLMDRERYLSVADEYLEYLPDFVEIRAREMIDDDWVRIALTGDEYPDAYDGVDPARMRRQRSAAAKRLRPITQRIMNNEISWCVAGVPVVPWAQKVFPDLDPQAALDKLWELVLQVVRADQPDPVAAWQQHDANLKKVPAFMDRNQVRAIRYLDEKPGPDGKASTDLTVGLTAQPAWSCGSAINSKGLPFLANIPTEEIFTTPHRDRVTGWVRTSKPGFPFDSELLNAYFRFEDGLVVEWDAVKGRDLLDQLFEMEGARQLGETSLVDVRSPINQAGVIFHDTLFDENAASHIAFGRGYPEGIKDGNQMSTEEVAALGLNNSDAHQDLMIGTDTMKVIGIRADGSEVLIMQDGMFVDDVLA
ncbi:MAG: aminopeptidase [Anaerolineae bacterium]|nr:aminopeptidase [Anaerolineae bacterium]